MYPVLYIYLEKKHYTGQYIRNNFDKKYRIILLEYKIVLPLQPVSGKEAEKRVVFDVLKRRYKR
jgi:hypothetical protein